jgi:hypothetical protein
MPHSTRMFTMSGESPERRRGRVYDAAKPRRNAAEADRTSKMVRRKDKEAPKPKKPAPEPAGGVRFSDWAAI